MIDLGFQSVILRLALEITFFFSVARAPLKIDHYYAVKMEIIQLLGSLFTVILYLNLLLPQFPHQ